MKAKLTLNPSLIARVCFWTIAILVLLSLIIDLGFPTRNLALSKLSLDTERSPGALFAFILFMMCAICLAAIALHERELGSRWWRHWAVLAAIFVLLAYDEAAAWHETLTKPLRAWLDSTGWLYWAWVIPGIIFVAVVFLAYLPFLRALPPVFRNLFLLAGALFVGGALGLEMVGASHNETHGFSRTYKVLATVEETMEMAATLLFLCALLKYFTSRGDRFDLEVTFVEGSGATLPTPAGGEVVQPDRSPGGARRASGPAGGRPAVSRRAE